MSRTYKDRPIQVIDPEYDWRFGTERIECTIVNFYGECTRNYRVSIAGARTKKKRSWRKLHGMPTPMWWVRMMMNRPQRTATKQWERQVVRVNRDSILDEDTPSVSKKPHIYYW